MFDVTWPVVQKKKELEMLQEFLSTQNLKTVLEIGTQYGGTALLWAKMVEGVEGHVYCVDFTFAPHRYYVGTPQQSIITEINGDSHNPVIVQAIKDQVGMVDFLFIDADHSYAGVKADFDNFSSLVKPKGFIGFHDITNMTAHNVTFGVHQFWSEIKPQYTSWEFIDSTDKEYPVDFMGIGLIQTKE